MSDINTQDIRDYLVGLVNEKEDLTLDVDTLTFGEPVLVDATVLDFSRPGVRNSSVKLTRPAAAGQLEVDLTVKYNRLSLEQMFRLRSPDFADTIGTHLTNYLDAINERTGGRLRAEDIVEVEIRDQVAVTLAARPDSLYAFGSVVINIMPENSVFVRLIVDGGEVAE